MTDSAILVQQPAKAAQLVLLFHGVGANAAGLRPLAEHIATAFPNAMVVAVNAPFASGNPGGFQWFSVAGITEENRQDRVNKAMPRFSECIAHWQKKAGVDAQATALVGFSQGAIMALESTKLAHSPASRVVAMSGRFANVPQTGNYTGTIHFLHGKDDPVIPYQHTVRAAHQLRDLGVDITAEVLPFVQHEIPAEFVTLAVNKLSTHISHRIWKEAMQADTSTPSS
jgi:phospholipase/carboxylesterase